MAHRGFSKGGKITGVGNTPNPRAKATPRVRAVAKRSNKPTQEQTPQKNAFGGSGGTRAR